MKLEVLKYLSMTQQNLPPLIFVHGGSHAAWCWEENFLLYFALRGFSSYALSFRGHGNSEGKEDIHSFTLQDYSDDVLQVIKSLKEKPILIGHSMGGAVVQKVLSSNHQDIKAVVLMSSVPPEGMLKDLTRMVTSNLSKASKIHFFNREREGEFPVELFFSLEMSDEKKDEYVSLLQPESKKASKELTKRIINNTNKAIIPMLVLGSKKDYIFSEKTAQKIAKTYGANSVIFEDVCHDMMLDPNWLKVAERIYCFLGEL